LVHELRNEVNVLVDGGDVVGLVGLTLFPLPLPVREDGE
jgi:hypothetical protein